MKTMKEKVKAALDEIRPSLQFHGGDVEFIELTKEMVVKVRLKGVCRGCPLAGMTLAMGIENTLKERIPEIKSVEAV